MADTRMDYLGGKADAFLETIKSLQHEAVVLKLIERLRDVHEEMGALVRQEAEHA